MDLIERLTPSPTHPIAAVILAARADVQRATADLLRVGDAALEGAWAWGADEADVRYGFYRCYETLEAGAVAAGRALEAAGAAPAPAGRLMGPATAARWDLHGLLAPLEPADWDADPGGGEWSIRRTMGHIVGGQRAYGAFTGWWLSQRGAAELAPSAPDDLSAQLPDEADEEAVGEPAEVRARLDDVMDRSAGRLGMLDDAALAVPARWSGIALTVGFRINRWSSHLREHTIQVEKTLAMISRTPSEVERLVRLVLAAYGRLEAAVFTLPDEALERSPGGGLAAPASIVATATREVADHAASIASTASS